MNEEKIKEVFSDEKFVNSLLELDTPEDVQKALAAKDIDLSVEDIKKIAEILQKKTDGELVDEDLENVAGGSVAVLACFVAASATLIGASVTNVVTRRRW